MSKSNKIILFISYVLCLYHFVLLIFYARKSQIDASSGLGLEGSLNVLLSHIHLGILFSLMIFSILFAGKKLLYKVLSFFASLFAIGIYYWWYLEKYDFLKLYGLKEQSLDYQKWLMEIGIWRGGTLWEYFAFVLTLGLLLSSLVAIVKSFIYSTKQ